MKTKVLLWLGFLAIFFIPWLWYDNAKELIIGGDLTFPLNPGEYFLSIFHVWRRVYAGTHSAISLTTVPFYAPMAVADWLGFSLQTVQKIHFGLWLALPAVSMYYLAGVIFRNHPHRLVAQLVAVSLYLFNTYEVVWADSARMAVWVGLPLMLGFFIEGLEDKKRWLRYALGIGFASVLTSTAAANPPMFLVMLAVFGLWLIVYLIAERTARTKQDLWHIGRFIGVAFLASLLINLFWIVPYAKVLFAEYASALGSGLEGIQFTDWLGPVSTHTSLLNVLRLQGAWDWYAGWQGEPYVPAAAPYQRNVFYLLWSVLVPIVVFGALAFRQSALRYRYLFFFAILALFGLFFGAGSHSPTGEIYEWLIEKIPFLSIYRSPWYKFTTWTVLGYSLLGAATLVAVYGWLKEQAAKQKSFKVAEALIALFLIANLIYASGLVLGKVFPRKAERQRLHSAHVTFPDYFFRSADWANQQPGDFRIVQLPFQEAFNYNWGLGTLMDMSLFAFQKPTLWWPEQTGSGPAKPGAETLVKTLGHELYRGSLPGLARLFGWLNVSYLLQKDDIDYSFYGGTDSPEFVTERFREQGFTLAHQGGPWRFFALPGEEQRSLFFPTGGYAKVPLGAENLLAAGLSPRYRDDVSLTDTEVTLPSNLDNGSFIRPDLTQAQLIDGTLRIPFRVPKEGIYHLAYQSLDPISLAIDGQPVSTTVTGTAVQVSLTLATGAHELTITTPSGFSNLIDNGSFEEGEWEPPHDMAPEQPGEASFHSELLTDATHGERSVKLGSDNHPAVIRKGIDNYDPGYRYLVSLDYKAERDSKFMLRQVGAVTIETSETLPSSTDWQTHRQIVTPHPLSNGAYLHLYADPGKPPQPISVSYDQVSIVKLPLSLSTLVLQQEGVNPGKTPELTFEKVSPTHFTVNVNGAPESYVLNFLEAYHPGWRLEVKGKQLNAPHFSAFGYANGWVVDTPGSYTLDVTFTPQKELILAGLISTIAALISLFLLWRRRKGRP